jgi:transposase
MYPLDRRTIAIHIYSLLGSLRKTAKLLLVSHSTISRWLKTPQKKQYTFKCRSSIKSDIIVDVIKCTLKANPFTSLRKLQNVIATTLDITVSLELIRLAIKKLGFTKQTARFYGQPKDLEVKTKVFLEQRDQYLSEGRHFVSIDETSFGRKTSTVKGYSPKNQKLFIKSKQPRVSTVSSICGVSRNSIHHVEYKTSINTEIFLQFLRSLQLKSKTVVLLDNVKFHHSKSIKDFCFSNDITLLYVPPYSPWFNPIELCFSIVKRTFYQVQDIETSYKSLTVSHLNRFFDRSLTTQKPF